MTFYLAKPFRFTYIEPDIANFPNQVRELAKDFNFLAEIFKFFPKHMGVALEGDRVDTEGGVMVDEIPLSGEYLDTFNEYDIPQHLVQAILYDGAYNPCFDNGTGDFKDGWGMGGQQDYVPTSNNQVFSYYKDVKGANVWGYHSNWVSGLAHFNIGLFENEGEYIWGEKVGSSLFNVDFIAEAHEWNHLEEKKKLGLAGLFDENDKDRPKDAELDGDVAQAYFVNEFLQNLNLNWENVKTMLGSGGRGNYSYYQLIMNRNAGKTSYANMDNNQILGFIAAMIESRNRYFGAMQKIFGRVDLTWNDQAMMANLSNWLGQFGPAASHGVNAIRMFQQLSHFNMNMITQFYENGRCHGFPMGMLDRYNFWQFSKEMGAEYYMGVDRDGDGNITTGRLFEIIAAEGFDLAEVADFLRADLGSLGIHTKPSNIGLPDTDYFNNLSPTARKRIRAYKWLLEQWFGATKVRAGYNSMPKWEGYRPGYSITNGDHYNVINGIRIPKSMTIINSDRSYGWDRVAGPYQCNPSDPYIGNCFYNDNPTGWINMKTGAWLDIYNGLRAKGYQLSYMNPYATGNNVSHRNYFRMQFAGLGKYDIIGKGTRNEVFHNSWAVFSEGSLTLAGERTDKKKMMIYQFLNDSERIRFKRAEDKYREEKYRIKDEQWEDERQEAKITALKRELRKRLEKMDKQEEKRVKEAQKKEMDRLNAKRQESNRSFSKKKQQKQA